MHSDYDAMIIHKLRMRELLQEAHEHRLASMAKATTVTLRDRIREAIASINTKLYMGPARAPLDCVLLPSAC